MITVKRPAAIASVLTFGLQFGLRFGLLSIAEWTQAMLRSGSTEGGVCYRLWLSVREVLLHPLRLYIDSFLFLYFCLSLLAQRALQ